MNKKKKMKKKKNKRTEVRTAKRFFKAGVTLEAAMGIPVFLFAAVCLIYLIEVQSIRLSIKNASWYAAKDAVEDTAVLPVLNSIKLRSDIVSLIGEERIERSILENGSSSISCWKSYMSPASGELNIIVDYKIRIPIPVFGEPSASFREQFQMSAWTGYQDQRGENGDSDIVYITDNGLVYHEDRNCSYLQLSIRFVPYTSLSVMRNEYGGRYYRCEKCAFGSSLAGVYITESGNRYHNSLNCSGLKRTVHAVERSEAGLRGACSRCSE